MGKSELELSRADVEGVGKMIFNISDTTTPFWASWLRANKDGCSLGAMGVRASEDDLGIRNVLRHVGANLS